MWAGQLWSCYTLDYKRLSAMKDACCPKVQVFVFRITGSATLSTKALKASGSVVTLK